MADYYKSADFYREVINVMERDAKRIKTKQSYLDILIPCKLDREIQCEVTVKVLA